MLNLSLLISLEMQKDGGVWTKMATIADSLAYTVKNLVENTKYKFRVRAENVHGCSEPSQPTEDVVVTKPIEQQYEDDKYTNGSHISIKSGGEFKIRFELMEELGKGRFGVVHKVIEKESGLVLAAKVIKCIKSSDRAKVREEIEIMKSLQHPKLLQLSASFDTAKEIIMVME